MAMIILEAHKLVRRFYMPQRALKRSDLEPVKISSRFLSQVSNATTDDIDLYMTFMRQRGYAQEDVYIYFGIMKKACSELLSCMHQRERPEISLSTRLGLMQGYIMLHANRNYEGKKYSIKTFASKPSSYTFEYPRIVQAETLAACSAKCSFCPYDSLSRKGEKMSWSLIDKLASEFESFPDDFQFNFAPFKVSDPFLDERLPKIASLVLNSHPLVKVGLSTNGSYMPQQMLKELLTLSKKFPNRIEISISLNTVDPEEYKKLMKLDIKHTINNINYIRDNMDMFASSGISNVTITRVSTDPVGDLRFRKFAKDYKRYKSGDKNFFIFDLANLNGWINHDAGEYSTKNVSTSVSSLFTCEEWQRLSLLPNGDFSLCCMESGASSDRLNFSSYTLKQLYKMKIQKYMPLTNNGLIKGRKYSASPCNSCDFAKRSDVVKRFEEIVDFDLEHQHFI